MHFVYDFDATLFKTSALWEAWTKVMKDFGGDEEEIISAGETLFREGFTLEKHGELLRIRPADLKRSVQTFTKMTKSDGPSLVFDDVHAFLEDHAEEHKQTILTFGDHDYQHEKIQASALMDFIDDIRIASLEQSKTEHLRELVESGTDPIVFIDDNPRELEAVHESGLPMTLMRMVRDGERHAEEEHELDDDAWTCIRSLEEIHEHI
jgi:FMN phosphatase YigB (HAD superfamily)